MIGYICRGAYMDLNYNCCVISIRIQMDDKDIDDVEIDEQDQIFAEDHSVSPDDVFFDEVALALQQIIFDQSFQSTQTKFMTKYCKQFEDNEENKNQYMEIFTLYQKEYEHFLQNGLSERVQNFSMEKFLKLLEKRTDQIDQQILDMIQSFTDFEVFKKLMIEHRNYLQNESHLKSLAIKSNKLG